LLIAVVRSWGVSARFATGYLDPDFFASGDEDDDPLLHAQSMRAWADVLIPGAGWRGFDPADGLVVNDSYVRVAAGRDADDVLLERATFKGEGADPRIRWRLSVSPA
jgi:transglutaminase-like putative cysteine protease